MELGKGDIICWTVGVNCGVFVVKREGVSLGLYVGYGASLWLLWVWAAVVSETEIFKLLGLTVPLFVLGYSFSF